MPFTGELMTCVVCGVQELSNPEIETDWRALELDKKIYYACPSEFPGRRATSQQFKAAYQLVLACCLSEFNIESGLSRNPQVEIYRKQCRKNRASEFKK